MHQKTPPHEIYRTHMMDAKLRLISAERVLAQLGKLSGLPTLDAEYCFLQIRRIIETITFSAIIREVNRYRKQRQHEKQASPRDHGDPSKDWQAPDILRRLVKLSPHVLPIPLGKASRDEHGLFHFDRTQIATNHDRLIEIYKKCGGFLHATNPLSPDYTKQIQAERRKYEAAPKELERSLSFLRTFLWSHAAVQLEWTKHDDPFALENAKTAWLVDFGTNEDSDIRLAIAVAQ